MNCSYPKCDGAVVDLVCDKHGQICSHCGEPSAHTRPDRLCRKCGGRADGEKCYTCGSPWIYLTYYRDGKWRCKPCVSNIIEDEGFLDSKKAIQKMKDDHQQRTVREKEHQEKRDELAKRVDKTAKRGYSLAKQEESLFVLEKPKKKR